MKGVACDIIKKCLNPEKIPAGGIEIYTSQSIVSTHKTLYILIYTVMSMFYSANLQNRLISNSHCSTKLFYVCGGEGYCEFLVHFADFLFIVHVILLFQLHP